MLNRERALIVTMFLLSFGMILMELLLTRLFAIVLFAQFAHLALALALLGISIGAILQHLWPNLVPDEGLERRLAWLAILQAVLTLAAVVASIELPVTVQFEEAPTTYQERSSIRDDLLDPFWFSVLLPFLTAPFACAGLAFAGTFQRRREQIGTLYGADLIGGAVGAVVFIPLLGMLAGPDVAFGIAGALLTAAALLFATTDAKPLATASWVGVGVMALLCGVSATGTDVLKIEFSAGYAEENVTYSEWTALTRVSIHQDDHRGSLMILDNTSASEVFETESRREEIATTVANRSLVWRLHKPPARGAVLAASAGPEVAVAQYYGHTNIDAVDIAGEIFDIVAERFPDSPVNPYVQGNTRRIKSDGRAAVLHAQEPYDVIQMVHANLWSSAGLLSNAWSPSLLETQEAFETYLDRLSDDGTISFGRGKSTDAILKSATAALRSRGVKAPYRHMFYGRADTSILLVKKRPWTQAERDHAWQLLQEYKRPRLIIDPMVKPEKANQRLMYGAVMTDNRPYLDEVQSLAAQLRRALSAVGPEGQTPFAVLYRSILLQAGFAMVAGMLFIGIPFLRRGPTQLAGLKRVPLGLLYVCCLGYGYLAVETVLIHELVLFVGHPTYAVTVTILAMLAASGMGSIWSERIEPERRLRTLRLALVATLVLGLVHVFVVPAVLYGTALGLPMTVRLGIIMLVLAPLGFVMGMPFPLGMSLLRPEAGGIVPWAWALNGWMSVVASLLTVLVSRLSGYSTAVLVALGGYGLALALSGVLPRIQRET